MIKKRESNFELLRILACLMVISHHFIVKGNGAMLDNSFSLQQMVYMLLLPGGKIGVNCFVLLTGYFLSNKPANTERVLRMIWTVTVYSLFGNILAVLLGKDLTAGSWKAAILPIAYNTMGWFIAPFLVLTMLSPFLNEMVNHLNQTAFVRLLICFTGICVVCPNVLPHASFFIDQFGWFMYLYLIGAYLRRFPAQWMNNRRSVAMITAVVLLLNVAAQAALRILFHTKPNKLELADYYAVNGNSILCLAAAVMLFLLCRRIKFQNRAVNWVASSCFGVYLLTDCTVLEQILWEKVDALALYQRTAGEFLTGAVLCIAAVFVIAFILAKVLYYLLEKPLFGLWCKLDALWEKFLTKMTERILPNEGEN